MDLYCMDKKLSELGEHDFDELLDTGVFAPASQTNMIDHFGLESSMDGDWLDNFLIDPVLNDRMISDAMQPQNVQSEHSYSLAKGEGHSESPLNLKMESKNDKGLDPQLLQTVNPNMTMTMTLESPEDTTTAVKDEDSDMTDPVDLSIPQQHQPMIITTTTSALSRDASTTLLRQPTIIVATSSPGVGGPPDLQLRQLTYSTQSDDSLLLASVKQELLDNVSVTSSPDLSDAYDSLGLPPTPPSTSGSDSDTSLRGSPPSSPIHKLTYASQSQYSLGQSVITSTVSFQPIPSSGMLLLTEEEKRTLVAEGYPIPGKLPLSKHEEKNLKKVRRKIKNKISAQESRRKKKEYLENLEKRLELYNKENTDLKRQVNQLENSNGSLTMQLQKLQNLVGKVTGMSGVSAPKTSTCLMALVLSFALFLGTWSPLAGGGLELQTTVPLSMPIVHGMGAIRGGVASALADDAGGKVPMGPELADPYNTPNVRSRVLMSTKEETDETLEYAPHLPFTYKDLFIHWFSSDAATASPMFPLSSDVATVRFDAPAIPSAEVADNSATLDQPFRHSSIQPHVAANVPTQAVSAKSVNATS